MPPIGEQANRRQLVPRGEKGVAVTSEECQARRDSAEQARGLCPSGGPKNHTVVVLQPEPPRRPRVLLII